jgi:hypothetical protein
MAVPRALAFLAVVAVSLTAALPATATGSSTGACAQRVIRDWYSGGRVDGVYPLRCYRAAIRSLPDDVLQYTDARGEIERALAARGARDPGRSRVAPPAPEAAAKERSAVERSELAAREASRKSEAPPTPPAAPARTTAPTTAAATRTFDDPVQLAARDDVQAADAGGLPYPVVVLATLAALLLVSAAAARVMTRRRGSGSTPDR